MTKNIRVSIYFMWEWWEEYFHKTYPRPTKVSDDALVDLYLKRKRYLYEKLGEFGVGEENPVMDAKYVNMVTKWGMDFIPKVLGAKLTCTEAGGYNCEKMNIDTIKKLKPVNLVDTPVGDWVIKRKSELLKRYGNVTQAIHLEGVTNIAVRIRGEEFYIDLIEDEALATHILEVVTGTTSNIYAFLGREFGLNALQIGNCNVTLMSPELYENMILKHDQQIAYLAEKITGKKNSIKLHHCDVPVDKFINVYKKIPGIYSLEASYKSDIKRVHREMPGIIFAAMVSPLEMMLNPLEQLEIDIDMSIENGAGELDIWNIDPSMDITKLKNLFSLIQRCCERNDSNAVFDVMPFCWDELEWAFPRYQR